MIVTFHGSKGSRAIDFKWLHIYDIYIMYNNIQYISLHISYSFREDLGMKSISVEIIDTIMGIFLVNDFEITQPVSWLF